MLHTCIYKRISHFVSHERNAINVSLIKQQITQFRNPINDEVKNGPSYQYSKFCNVIKTERKTVPHRSKLIQRLFPNFDPDPINLHNSYHASIHYGLSIYVVKFRYSLSYLLH